MISVNRPGKAVLFGALIPVGSRHEAPQFKGVSHFLEHMMFKGTLTRTKNQLTEQVEKYGALFNAYTSEECTFYYVKISNKFADVARDVITDMVNNSILPSDELTKERQVVLQELQMYEDNPRSAVFEHASKYLYHPDSGLHVPIIGTFESLANINRAVMQEHYFEHYRHPIYIQVGDVQDEKEFIRPDRLRSFSVENQNSDFSDVLIPRKGITQANMLMTGLLDLNPHVVLNEASLKLFEACMNGFTGRLFKTIREEKNMVYHVSFGYQPFSCGTVQFYVYAGLDPARIQEAKGLILEELSRPFSDEELDFAAKKLIGESDLDRDGVALTARQVVESVIRNIPLSALTDDVADLTESAKKRVNEFQSKVNFAGSSKLVAIVPER
jgi:predicted Zn-dependent peptidase